MKISIFSVLRFTLLVSVLFLVDSCASRKDVIYFQDNQQAASHDTLRNYSIKFQPSDILSITVSSIDPLAASPYNLYESDNKAPEQSGPINKGGTQNQPGYLIDSSGMINFPGLGMIKVAGLNRMEATELLMDSLSKYIRKPIVNIRLLNFKITILGDVKTAGSFIIADERITLPEAIGLVGDLEITGVRKNVLVIRDIGGKKTFTRVNLATKDVFSSPVYYLKQNDIVYVEPNSAKITAASINSSVITLVSILLSAVSIIIAFLTFIKIK